MEKQKEIWIEGTPSNECTSPLSPNDLMNEKYILYQLWQYDGELKIDNVLESLKKTLDRYPEIGSKMKNDNGCRIFDHSKPAVRVIMQTIDQQEVKIDKLKPNSLPDPIENLITGGLANNEVFKVKITHVTDRKDINPNQIKKSFLGVIVSHALVDGNTFFGIVMKCWSMYSDGKEPSEPPIEFRRKHLWKKNGQEPSEEAFEQVFGKQGWTTIDKTTCNKNLVEVLTTLVTDFPSSDMWQPLHLYFTKSVLGKLRTCILNGRCGNEFKDRILSTNDIVCSWVYKMTAHLRKAESSKLRMYVVVNLRKFFEVENKDNFFGNTTMFTMIKEQGSTILEQDLSEVALKIRNQVEGVTKKDAEEFQEYLEYSATNHTIQELTIPGDHQLNFWISNNSKFGVYTNARFHNLEPVAHSYILAVTPNGFFILPSATGDGVVAAGFCKHEEVQFWNKLYEEDPTAAFTQ